ncbi:hypothetical protein NA57DRAFT_70789 [Rhizodiscina lignyota]|uniref:Zn(2)-C6 fungal-type domain-containing protein n=1 Tax=Rhizodiscina lignyota TaxID=1504668 RepID=A0A9P4IRQ1_9PEZI|nr:hypothetical protein NA57DRAFT_70789 [Rhizodiscina lignyota]
MDEVELPPRKRHRASTACIACRRTRVRCVLDTGQGQCIPCASTNTECVFDDKDGRKTRGSSKVSPDDLMQRIQQLEGLLKHQTGGEVPITPTGSESQQVHDIPSPNLRKEQNAGNSSQQNGDISSKDLDPMQASIGITRHSPEPQRPKGPVRSRRQSRALVRQLVPCPVKFDMASGRVRFFGPTTTMHILSSVRQTPGPVEKHQSHWPIAMLVRDMSPETHDYLMDLFWDCHNGVMHVVHKYAFYDDLKNGDSKFYSTFLHFAMLAIGFRYADKNRPDIRNLASTGHETCIMHSKARSLAQAELEKPGGIPSIQALYLLGDLEAGCGRDDTGWLYSGMAFRLVFDVGLHVDASTLQISELETQIRHMVLWACMISDKYWALFLGRPTFFKMADIAPSCLTKDFGRMIACGPHGQKMLETRVYEALLHLMDLVGKLCEMFDSRKNGKVADTYLDIAALDRDLNNWYCNISDELKWTPENIEDAPASYFLLHAQFYTALILLHRTFANYNAPAQNKSEAAQSNHFSRMSRTVCAENAMRIASIFEHYREKYDLRKVYVSGMQYAGAAATALMAEIISLSSEEQRKKLLDHLLSLGNTLNITAKTYEPAVLMSNVISRFVKDFSDDGDPGGINGRRRSNGDNPTSTPSPNSSVATSGAQTLHPHITDPGGVHGCLPYLPASWFEGMSDLQDTAFLNLMGLSDLQHTMGLGGQPDGSAAVSS